MRRFDASPRRVTPKGHNLHHLHSTASESPTYTATPLRARGAPKIVGAAPDALYYSGYYAEFALLTKALKAKGFSKPIMSGDGANDDQFITQAGAAVAEGAYLSCPCGDANVDPKAAAFLASFKSNNGGKTPGTYSPEGYDAANAIISVLKKLGPSGINRQAVADAFKTIDVPGISKQVKFSSTGEVESKDIFIYQVKGGKRSVLGTSTALAK